MNDVDRVVRSIVEGARAASREVRFVRACAPGEAVRQGDVYLYALAAPPRHGAELSSRQLAPGTSVGSRHVLAGPGALHARAILDAHDGPYLHARSRVTITHPEHAHISLPAGWYEVRFQVDYELIADAPADGRAPRPWQDFLQRAQRVRD
jgi:hypothetical protein